MFGKDKNTKKRRGKAMNTVLTGIEPMGAGELRIRKKV
jgi:hypothetical protein